MNLLAILKRSFARFESSRRKRGVIGTLRAGQRHAWEPFQFRYREWKFDRTLVVDTRQTSGAQNKSRILSRISSSERNAITGFGSSDPAIVVDVLGALPIRHEDYAFVDIGCGKGRVLLIASQFPFRKVAGVELSEELAQIAQRNVRERQGPPPVCRDVQAFAGDGTAFPIPDGPVLLFVCNPFHEEHLMERFLANVQRSWEASRRPVRILYLIPRLASVFERFSVFEKSPAPLALDGFLYRTPDPEPPSARSLSG